MNNPSKSKLKLFTIVMMNNKQVNNNLKPIKVPHIVKHNKNECSKVKTNDNPESVLNRLTKPVDKIHTSYFMLMGKKNKNTKKNKKDKTKKKIKKTKKTKKNTQKNKKLKKNTQKNKRQKKLKKQ